MIWLLVGAAVAAAVLLRVIGRRARAKPWPVRRRAPLSRAEQVLYWRLCEACPDHIVLAQVTFAQLLEVEKGANRQAVFNRYRRLVADFVVCARSFGVVAVIELDDGMPRTPGRVDADARKSGALGAAGIPLMRLDAHRLPTSGELRSLLVVSDQPQSEPAAAGAVLPRMQATA